MADKDGQTEGVATKSWITSSMDRPRKVSLRRGRGSLGGIHANYFDRQIIAAIPGNF
jgi:hypothetical protein